MKGFFFQSFFSFVAVYLLIGVTGMMLLLTVFYSIPEFDVSSFFLLSCSSAKLNGIGNVNDLNDQTNGKIIQGKIKVFRKEVGSKSSFRLFENMSF